MVQLKKQYKIPRWLWWKKYFDTGYALTGYGRFAVAVFGLTSLNLKFTSIMGVIYVIFSYFLGMFWIKKKLFEGEREIDNALNPFQREVRHKLKNKIFK